MKFQDGDRVYLKEKAIYNGEGDLVERRDAGAGGYFIPEVGDAGVVDYVFWNDLEQEGCAVLWDWQRDREPIYVDASCLDHEIPITAMDVNDALVSIKKAIERRR